MPRRLLALLLCLAATCAAAAERPRTVLVLSGGGARGLAHVGVLKVLEELRVPVDAIAGTSMGAIVGGLYASGMDAATLQREVLAIHWDQVFASRVERPRLSQRRKEEDFEIATAIELGLRHGELRTPTGAVASRGLETLLRRFTLPVRHVQRFDALPIPFRAVATNMESGAAVVLDQGDLALALRSSMSVPGVFAPTEWDDQRILGDGGLVNNLPVDVGRALGGARVIAVNVGTPVAGRETLGSVLGLTTQMINILTEQNVQRSLAQLGPQDVLLAPALGKLGVGDFARVREFIAAGEQAARAMAPQLAALALPEAAYQAWRLARTPLPPGAPALAFVRIEGSEHTNTERLAAMLESAPGQAFDAERAERDTRRLAAGGDYVRADYRLAREAGASGPVEGLVFELEDKPWGPHYLRLGLDLSTDFSGRSAFNLKLSHNRHWLTPAGTEWRNRLQIGEVPLAYTELYHPLRFSRSLADDWFVSAYAGLERRRQLQFAPDSGQETAEWKRNLLSLGADIGQPWGDFGELRLGLSHVQVRTSPQLLSAGHQGPAELQRWAENGLRARVVVDQLDFANFPLHGHRFEGQAFAGRRSGDVTGSFQRLELQGSLVRSWGAHTLNLHARLNMADLGPAAQLGRYTLGGFHQLSGYQAGQLEGDALLLLRLGWYQRLTQTPTLTRGFFMGATLEAGNAWARRGDMRLGDLRSGASLYLGADTGLGPLYLGLTFAPGGSPGLALFIGRP